MTKKATLARNPRQVRYSPAKGPSVVWKLLAAFAVGAILAGGVVLAATRPSPVDQIRAEDAARDKTQIKELTELARATRDRLAPVLEGLAKAMPAEATAGPAAVTAADVENWRKAATAAVDGFADPPSGMTATNVARASLTSAVRQLATTVDTYAEFQKLSGDDAARTLELAVRQRTDAVFTWSVGATALDALNVDAGYGHQHIFLQSDGDGALTPDAEPEGVHHS
ncbi:hypothetical protein GCM10009677_08410 [Sphaerisporangium rubeum]|uniref:Uncharacterized protein n=1 Tax=Sphaerisporangium rubeum TaxID=321317 RepID=A0A7X0M5I4_9ACTN|nr:hypothetical protein [Sphaerisporangium rubeum]MBB6470856.1 hypothetical protein [Sphaerisporangium rubeum]